MSKSQVLEYTIYLTDKQQVDDYTAQLDAGTGPGALLSYFSSVLGAFTLGVYRAPRTGAAVEFSAPFQTQAELFSAPCTRSPWFTGGNNFPTNVATFTRKSGGWFGIPFLFGTTVKFYWAGKFAYAPLPGDGDGGGEVIDPGTGNTVVAPAKIPVRRWLSGFELGAGNPGESGDDSDGGVASFPGESSTRIADRGGDGYGASYRHAAGGSKTWQRQHDVVDEIKDSWERFYFRVRNLPGTSTEIANWHNYGSPAAGFSLQVGPAGDLALFSSDLLGVLSFLSTLSSGIVLHRWYRLDILLVVADTGTANLMGAQFYIDGGLKATHQFNPGGLAVNCQHLYSNLGKSLSTASALEIDFDGWRNAAIPDDKSPLLLAWNVATSYGVGDKVDRSKTVGGSPITFPLSSTENYICTANNTGKDPRLAASSTFWARLGPSIDWLNGSRMVTVRPKALAATSSGWVGPWQLALQQLVVGVNTEGLTSTTALAPLRLDTDGKDVIHGYAGSIGAVALVTGLYSFRGTLSGTMGTVVTFEDSSTAGAEVAITQNSTPLTEWQSVLLQLGSGFTLPRAIIDIQLRHTKGNDAVNSKVRSFNAVAEIIGIFGQEDLPVGSETMPARPGILGLHNSAYPRTPWAYSNAPPFGAVMIKGGTYTGNGTAQNLVLKVPPHWLWIRRITGTALGSRWWTSLLGAHVGLDQNCNQVVIPRALIDPDFPPAAAEDAQEMQALVIIASDNADVNESGVVYQYIAFCDPAARFILCGATAHANDRTFPVTDALADPQFTPLAGFFWPEQEGSVTTSTLAYKGPGHAAGAANLLSGAATKTAHSSFGTGTITTQIDAYPTNTQQTAHALFRNNDGNGEAHAAFQHATYVGNGVSPRLIGLVPAVGHRPMFAIVVGSDNGYQRDPSHTGSNSTVMGTGSENATGITAGDVDSITVGANLNTNGVTYHVFVFSCSSTAGNNGWGINEECFIEPDSPCIPPCEPPAPPTLLIVEKQILSGSDAVAFNFSIGPGVTPATFALTGGQSRSFIRIPPGTYSVAETVPAGWELVSATTSSGDPVSAIVIVEESIVTAIFTDRVLGDDGGDDDCLEELIGIALASVTAAGDPCITCAPITAQTVINAVTRRLGDRGRVWTVAEVLSYLILGYREMVHTTRLIWERAAITGFSATGVISVDPKILEIDRVEWEGRVLDPLNPAHLTISDPMYEQNSGNVYGYTWRKDGLMSLRLVNRPVSGSPDVEYWRLGTTVAVAADTFELPGYYARYLQHYALARCYHRQGPGQDHKLGGHYDGRWNRDLARVVKRLSVLDKQRVGRMGGGGGSGGIGPRRPKLPWNYGSVVR